jgi:hypothetical protein
MSQESKKQTAVEWLAEKYNHLALMRSNDEISAALAVEWLENFLEQALEMEKEQIMEAYHAAVNLEYSLEIQSPKEYYTETYGKQQNG